MEKVRCQSSLIVFKEYRIHHESNRDDSADIVAGYHRYDKTKSDKRQ